MTLRTRRLMLLSLAVLAAVTTGTSLFAALLLIGGGIGFPKVAFAPPSTTSYNATTDTLSVNAVAVDIDLGPPSGKRAITGDKSLEINITVNASGVVTGPYTATDLELRGDIDINGDSTPDYSGLLLSGRIVQFGFQNLAGTNDFFDFRFAPTGGALVDAGYFTGKDIGVSFTSEGSSFSGVFTTNFSGNAKGTLGPIALCPGKIGDFVWNDTDRDGIQDPGEPGINGVSVKLMNAANVVIATTTTTVGPFGRDGYYAFEGVCGGSYRVELDLATLPPGFVPSPTGQGGNPMFDSNVNPSDVTLPNDSAVDLTIDFGFNRPCSGKIGDFVWNDGNRDGIQDAGETGIVGVTIHLRHGLTNALLATTTTGFNGGYAFDNLCEGSYLVEIDLSTVPPGFVASPTLASGDTAVDSNPNPAAVTLVDDFTTDLTIDFGFNLPCAGEIGDFVWFDENRNGIQDPGEAGIDGVTLRLIDDATSTVLATDITGPNGYYVFKGRCGGPYRVEVDATTLPPGYVPAPTLVGADSAKDSNGSPFTLTLPDDFATDYTIDFGYMAPCAARIGDFVWFDANANGIQDLGEGGIGNVRVNLFNSLNVQVGTMLTGANGLYLFQGLCAGTYKVEVDTSTLPPGLLPSPIVQGGNTATDSNPNPTTVVLATDNAQDLTIDFGYRPAPAQLGDFVWEDKNANGVQESGEPGIPTVGVTLLTCAGAVVANASTNASGLYLFTDLLPGCYKVQFATPAGFTATVPNVGSDTTDSDAVGGVTGNYMLAADESNVTVDAGFYRPASLGDFVWKDFNSNGVQDAGEPGIPSVSVTLLSCAGAALSLTTTNASGLYLFPNLAPGCYKVQFATPAGFTPSPSNVGDDAKDSDAVGGVTGNYTLVSGQNDLTVDAGFFVEQVTCPPPSTFTLTGNSSVTGGIGNIRTFTAGGVSVNASAFSRADSNGAWATAYLGAYSGGLGVTDTGENGANDTHKTDNLGGRDNYVLFEFSAPVTVTGAYLDSIGVDSDMTVWIGTTNNPFVNHLTLSDAVLNTLTKQDNDTASALPRLAAFNGSATSGNVLVIAASTSDTTPNDAFKIKKLQTGCPPPTTCPTGTFTLTGNTALYGAPGNIRPFSITGVSAKASAFSRADSTGAWATAYLGSYGGGLGVTDTSENGLLETHKTDNIGGRDNYVLFEFSQPVTVTRAFLDSVGADSDITIWIGTKTDPFNNHLTLSDALLNSLAQEPNDTDSNASRWAVFNGTGVSGNVLVIAASTSDTSPEDAFKIKQLQIGCVPPPNPIPIALSCPAGATGSKGVFYSSALIRTGGVAPYLFSIMNGSLPNGLSLNATTGAITGTPSAIGTFNFTGKVVDSAAGTASTSTASCKIVISYTPPPGGGNLVKGDTATIGYWQNKNGQALIKSMSNQPALGNWLATNFPNMFGNLAGKTNAKVAEYFTTLFNVTGTKTRAQIMATALAVYVTNPSLAGNTATSAGFNVSGTGTGAKVYNVGAYGAAIGLLNNTSYPVFTLLKQADARMPFSTTEFYTLNNIFDGINVKGDR